MSNVKLLIEKTGLENAAGKAISSYIQEHKESSVLLLVSGGSARNVLEYIDAEVLGGNLTVSLVDERYTRDEEASNFLQLTHTQFYTKAKDRGVTFISPFPEEGESLDDSSKRWEMTLKEWNEAGTQSRTIVALMGMGGDGHIGGIIPLPEDRAAFHTLFQNDSQWILGYDAGAKNQHSLRMTTTISFLTNMVDRAYLFVKGDEKKSILKTVLESRDVPLYPATVIHTMKHVEVHTDIEV